MVGQKAQADACISGHTLLLPASPPSSETLEPVAEARVEPPSPGRPEGEGSRVGPHTSQTSVS